MPGQTGQGGLAPAQQRREGLRVVGGKEHDLPVRAGEQRQQRSAAGSEHPAVHEVQVLQDEEGPLAPGGKDGCLLLRGAVHPAVAQGVVQVAHAQLQEAAQIPRVPGGHQVGQATVHIPGGVGQVADFQRVPPGQVVPAANEAAGLLRCLQGVDDPPVCIQVGGGQAIQHHHGVNVAVRLCLPPQVAALQPDVDQTRAKGFRQPCGQTGKIIFRVEHHFFSLVAS